jgi:hypothetical protein
VGTEIVVDLLGATKMVAEAVSELEVLAALGSAERGGGEVIVGHAQGMVGAGREVHPQATNVTAIPIAQQKVRFAVLLNSGPGHCVFGFLNTYRLNFVSYKQDRLIL